MRWLGVLLLVGLLGGCTRAHYRRQADRETYSAIAERDRDPRWALPRISIDTPPQSRLHDPFNPDFPPMPPDDPAAHRYMHCVNGIKGYRHWHRDGDAPWIEDPAWRAFLDLTPDGVLILSPDRSIELGLLNSRQFQTQLEQLYLTSLALTLNRFEFAVHWFFDNDTTFTHFGSSADESNTLTTTSQGGFTKAFAAGGQLLVEFANTFVFQFAGSPDHTTVTSNIIVQLIQPILRRAGREVRLEGLTQAERNLLYAVRTFAHFRKQFSFQIITQTFLQQLLLQEQTIRNQRANVMRLEQQLRLQEALFAAGIVSTVQVDQTFQSLQTGRLSLLQAETTLETQLDAFKLILGLPPDIPVRLDESLLDPFQLADPALTDLQDEMEKFLAEYRELDKAPTLKQLENGFSKLNSFRDRMGKSLQQIQGEIDNWQPGETAAEEDKQRLLRERAAKKSLTEQLREQRKDLEALSPDIQKDAALLSEKTRTEGWETLQNRARQLLDVGGQLNVIQTQVRVYLINLKPLDYELDNAVNYALDNRLDLMNQRAQVVDAWRQITVTADALEADFDVIFNANIATKPFDNNPVDFRASASTYSIGFHFDAPLNRVAARNAYRTSQINYQQARRSYMALEDQIRAQIRNDMRQLKTQRLNFEIQRQSLISAARQVEAARDKLLVSDNAADTTGTIDILNALSSLLDAKNGLIGSWVNYETLRIQLKLDMEALQVDERGLYVDEDNNDRTRQPTPSNTGAPDQ
jgi:outer membrane protein TolC